MLDDPQQSTTAEQTIRTIHQERRLIIRLLAGESEAWSEFVDRYQRVVSARVNHVLIQYGKSVETNEADDVVADLFTSLLANNMRMLRRFEHRSTLATWLTIIAHRMSLRAAMKSKRKSAKTNQLDPMTGQTPTQSLEQLAVDPAENPLARLMTTENRSKIRHQLTMLKEADRQVIELFHFEKLSYREIASRMGMSENSVGPRLTRAQRRLRQLMEAPHES